MTQPLPDTQDLSGVVSSQVPEDLAWGVLYGTNNTTLALTKSEYVVGRAPSCDWVLSADIVGGKQDVLLSFSKCHFKLIYEANGVARLDDCSFNGTYVNRLKVGKGKSRTLQHNDKISLAHANYKAFVFMSKDSTEQNNYPEEVKRNYVVSHQLGSGACGEVRLVFQKISNERRAIKIVQKKILNDNSRDTTSNEIKILRALKHPCIIQFYDVINTPGKVFIVLELMDGGDLFEMVRAKGPTQEPLAKWIFYQIALGVDYLHRNGVAHRDLKPENILLSSDSVKPVVKITDFGLSKVFNSQMLLQTLCGTPMYVAPEVLETHGHGSYTNKVDIWSMGVILYVCLSARLPFVLGDENNPIKNQICYGRFDVEKGCWGQVSESAVDLIKSMMTVDYKLRANIGEILSSRWLQDKELKTGMRGFLNVSGDMNSPPFKRSRMAV